MNGYLQRLVSRGLGEASASAMSPVVRSRSPIADEDQRIGLPGFEGIGIPGVEGPLFRNEAPVDGRFKDMSIPPGDNPSPTLGSIDAGDRVAQKRVVGRISESGFATPQSEPASLIRDNELAREASNAVRVSQQTLRSGIRIEGSAIDPPSHFTSDTQVKQPPILTSTGRAVMAGDSSASGLAMTPAGLTGIERPEQRRRSVESDLPLLEPSPRPIRTPQQRDSIFLDAEASDAPAAQGPRVVIGRINVEVITQATAPKTSAASRPGPLTAESVSVIGPLTRGVRSNQRLSLRYR